MRRFINGKLEGTRLEIMPSAAATTLPDGTPILTQTPMVPALNATQDSHVDVHARQTYMDQDRSGDWYVFEGPSIAQQWRSEYNAVLTQRGWRARYYNTGVDPYEADGDTR